MVTVGMLLGLMDTDATLCFYRGTEPVLTIWNQLCPDGRPIELGEDFRSLQVKSISALEEDSLMICIAEESK